MHTGYQDKLEPTGRLGAAGYQAAYTFVEANAAAITAIDTAALLLGDGSLAIAMDTKDVYAYDSQSSAVPDGTTVLNATGAGRWLIIHASSATQVPRRDEALPQGLRACAHDTLPSPQARPPRQQNLL